MIYIDRFSNDRKGIIAELYRVIIVSVAIIYGAYMTTYSTSPKVGGHVAMLIAFSIGIASLLTINAIESRSKDSSIINDALMSGLSTNLVKGVLLTISSVVLIATYNISEREGRTAFEYPMLITLSTRGLMFIASSNDLITLYRSIEWHSRCMYVLASFIRGSSLSVEAGIKYFVLGSIASGCIILGIALIYSNISIVNYTDIYLYGLCTNGDIKTQRIFGHLLLLAGIAFKIGSAPLHFWVADVYQGAPISSVVYFAVVPKLVFVYVVMKLIYIPFGEIVDYNRFIAICGLSSIAIGTFGARDQTDIKRFRAYSSIANIGFIRLSIGLYTNEGIQASIIYIRMYTLMSASIWVIISSIRINSSDNNTIVGKPIRKLSDLTGLMYKSPLIAASISIVLLSIAGIPPLYGFISKLMVITAMINEMWYVSTIIVLLLSCVSAYYYLHIIKIMCFDPKVENDRSVDISNDNAILVALATVCLFRPLIEPMGIMSMTDQISVIFK